MAGDITRSTFQKSKHYTAVRMQQGRVQMDADWNEQADLHNHLSRTAALDLIGPAGAPVGNAGFQITASGKQLFIGPGRMYVNGLLCENEQLLAYAANPAFYTLAGTGPAPVLPAYKSGVYAAYLDVWEREITALDDPSIREVALGGPDTATRTKTVWQVKLWRLGDLGSTQSCGQNWAALLPASNGMMTARAEPDAAATTPCAIQAQAGYRSLENQLYRIQIHQGGTGANATFTWSRDNASIVAAWTGVDPANPNNLVVSTLGKDQVLGFAAGQWVELVDDSFELTGTPGTLVQLANAQLLGQSPTLTIDPTTASGPVTFAAFPLNPKIRRWDQAATNTSPLTGGAVPLVEGPPIALENGVQVAFTPGGTYSTGDFWRVPARTATVLTAPTVQWPADVLGNPLPQLAEGIHHAFCSLALLSVDSGGNFAVLTDCRLFFSPLAGPRNQSFHVTDVRAQYPVEELGNDTIIPFSTFINGVNIACDAPVDANSLSPATCQVTIDLPAPTTGIDNYGYYPAAMTVVLTGNATTGGPSTGGPSHILWTPTPECHTWLSAQLETFSKSTRGAGLAIARVKLRGAFINQLGNPASHLDGHAYGAMTKSFSGNTYIPIAYPTGNNTAGSDFETWFWVATDDSFPRPSYSSYGSGFQGIGGELL